MNAPSDEVERDIRAQLFLTAAAAGDTHELLFLAEGLHYADVADLIEQVPRPGRHRIFESIGAQLDPRVWTELAPDVRNEAVPDIGVAQFASTLGGLETDDVVEIVEELDGDAREVVVRSLPGPTREQVEQVLAFPEDSAGRRAQTDVVTVGPRERAGALLERLRSPDVPDVVHNLFVVDADQHPIGVIPLHRLVRAPLSAHAEEIMTHQLDTIAATTDQEDVAKIFRDHDLLSTVVIDDAGRVVGEVTIDDVVDVIDEEAEEDLLYLGGVSKDDIFHAPLRTVRSRFGWLLANLATAIAASLVIAHFDAAIEQLVALAVLMPIVASMGGNAGTQTMTVAVRALAAKELGSFNTWRFVAKEMAVGSVTGILFALIMGVITAVWFGHWALAGVMAIAMLVNIAVAATVGAAIPTVLQRLGADPAVGSTVLVTTITDVVGFITFLGLAAALLL